MSSKPRKCVVCKGPVELRRLNEISGREGTLDVTVHGMPVLECSNGHRQFAQEDFPLLLLDHLVEKNEPRLPASDTKGMLFKHHHCSSCGAELGSPPDRQHTFHMDIELPAVERFDVELTIPVHHCPQCGHEQVHSVKEVRSKTPAALAHAFKAADIAAH